MLHCHILQHMIMGMNTVWVVGGYEELMSVWPVVPYVSGYLDYGGDAYGNETWDPRVVEYFGEG